MAYAGYDYSLPPGSLATNGQMADADAHQVLPLQDIETALDYVGTKLQALELGDTTYPTTVITGGRKVVINPSLGDDFQARSLWASVENRPDSLVEAELADGLQDVNTFVDIVGLGYLRLKATGAPDYIPITGATFTLISANNYTTVISLSSALPARVVVGYSLGGQNVQGDGAADSLNGGHIVTAIAGDRLSFTTIIHIRGVVPTDFTTPDATASIGLTPNQLVVPKCCLRVNGAGWDGAAREGFFNALSGGRIYLESIGMTYNGTTSADDMLFAANPGSSIELLDCVVAGAGEMVMRTAREGAIYSNRCCLGASNIGGYIIQCSEGGSARFVRTMMGSASAELVSVSTDGHVSFASCVLTGSNHVVRTNTAGCVVSISTTRISRGELGITATKGTVHINRGSVPSNNYSVIKNCTTPISLAGGWVHGDPVITDNTNAAPASNEYSVNGGAWARTNTRLVDPTNYLVGTYAGVQNFGSVPANSFLDSAVTVTGAAFGDECMVMRATATLPAQNLTYEAFVSAADTVTIRAINFGTAAIDPAAANFKVTVRRAS